MFLFFFVMFFCNIWYFPGKVHGNNIKKIISKSLKNLIMLCDEKKKKKEKASTIIKSQKTNNKQSFLFISSLFFKGIPNYVREFRMLWWGISSDWKERSVRESPKFLSFFFLQVCWGPEITLCFTIPFSNEMMWSWSNSSFQTSLISLSTQNKTIF